MPANSLTAKANVGAGVDNLAGVNTAQGFAGAAMLVDATGADVSGANPLPTTSTVVGAQADAAATSDTGTFSIVAFVKRALQNWTTLLARTPALGQAVMASSSPVVIASNQSAVPVSGTVTATGVAGVAAHSAAASGNPVQVGGVVSTAVSITEANGEVCRMQMTTGGAQTVKLFSVPEVDWTYASAAGGINNITDVSIKAAAGVGVRNYLTGISIVNASATIATEVVVKDGATIIGRWYVGTGALLNSAIGLTFPTPLRGTANTALNVACITTGAQVYVNAQGYVAP